jgi:ribosome-associated toxin RatA of RatAB toxin-antitoxin module
MAQADIKETLNVDYDKLFAAITRYEDYPKFVEGCKSVKVERKGPGKARVTYHVSLMKDVTYTLDHEEDPATGDIRWSLVESEFFKKNSGSWKLKKAGPGKTEAFYQIELDFKIMVPGFILKGLVKGNLPSMIKSFEKQAQKL